MIASATLFHTSPLSKMATPAIAGKGMFSPPPATFQSPSWRSPVPFLFGGLAAMLGLIVMALVILACSYWRPPALVNGGEDGGERVAEGGDAAKGDSSTNELKVFEEKFLVIMAGDVRPTFLATPTTGRASTVNDEKIDR